MTYASLEKQIHSVPEEYLNEISEFIDFILYKAKNNKSANRSNDLSSYFGCLIDPIDGMEFQRNVRDEWD